MYRSSNNDTHLKICVQTQLIRSYLLKIFSRQRDFRLYWKYHLCYFKQNIVTCLYFLLNSKVTLFIKLEVLNQPLWRYLTKQQYLSLFIMLNFKFPRVEYEDTVFWVLCRVFLLLMLRFDRVACVFTEHMLTHELRLGCVFPNVGVRRGCGRIQADATLSKR